MFNNTIYNYLVWDDVKNIPFPEEVKPLLKNIEWDKFVWQCVNLPIPFAKYAIVCGEKLYQDTLPDGKIEIQEVSFTGEVPFGAYFIDHEKKEKNFLVFFKVLFFKGKAMEVLLDSYFPHNYAEFEAQKRIEEESGRKKSERENAWWAKYLYRPYSFIVRGLAMLLAFPFGFVATLIIWLANKLTPLDS